jgi:hypothetical protein
MLKLFRTMWKKDKGNTFYTVNFTFTLKDNIPSLEQQPLVCQGSFITEVSR